MRILILCTGNSCRSQIAEGFFRRFLGENDFVASAGLTPQGLNPFAVSVMAEIGIDISNHSSDHIDHYLNSQFDFVITVCDNAAANCPVFPGAHTRLHWSFDDPAAGTGSEEEILGEFRRVRDEIKEKVRAWLRGKKC